MMKNRRQRTLAALLMGAVLIFPLSADAMRLSLEDAIDTALSANTGLRITREGERSADAALRQARGKNSISVGASDSLRTSKASDAEAAKKIEVQRDSVEKYDAHLRNVNALYEAGAQAKIDVIRSSVELSNARQELIRAESSYEVNLAALRNLLNIDRSEPLQLTTEVSYEPFGTALTDCISYAQRMRLDLAAQRETLQQRELAVDIARAGKKPTVNLTLGTGLTSQFRPHSDTSSDVSASVGVNWNIFDSNVTRGAIDAAEAERDIALLNVKKTEESIDLNLRQAYLNMREAEQRFTSTGDAVRQAEEDYRIASERYRAGEGILLDILDAQTALTTARQNALSARYDYARYRAQVESLMGKELSAEEHAAAEGLPAVTDEERTAARAAYAEGTDAAARGEKS